MTATNEIISAAIAFGGLVAIVIGMAVKATRDLSNSELEIRQDFDAQIDNLHHDIRNLTERIAQADAGAARQVEKLRLETGEMGNAFRAKIHEIEMFSRDNFVRNDTFEKTMDRFEKTIDSLGDRIEKRIAKFEEKIDKLTE